jgi:hypothetical protein
VRLVVEDGLPYQAASWHFMARSPGFCPFRHHPELGRGRGEKRRRGECGPAISTGP